MGSSDELQAFSNTVAELSNEYIEKLSANENVPDLLKTVAEQAGVELFDNDGTFRVRGSWLSVSNAQSYFVEFLRTYIESTNANEPEPSDAFHEHDETVLPVVSDPNLTQNLESVEDEIMDYLSRKALASCTVPLTRKRSFVNGKPNTFSAASSIPDPIVELGSLEQQREFSNHPEVPSNSRNKSIKVLRNLYDIDRNIKSLKKNKSSRTKNKLAENKTTPLKQENLQTTLENTSAENMKESPQDKVFTKTKLENKDDPSSSEIAAVENGNSLPGIQDGKPYNDSECLDSTQTAMCENDINEDKASDDIAYNDDVSNDPDYNCDEGEFSVKKETNVEIHSSKVNKIQTRSSTVNILPSRKGRGRPRKAASTKLKCPSKFTTTKTRTTEKSVVITKVKENKCSELAKHESKKGCPKGGGSKVIKEYNCKSCPYVTPRKFHLKEHEKRRHNMTKSFKCEICSKIFGFHKDLNRHRNTHLKPENCCDICGKLYKGVKTLAQHKLTHDATYVKPEFCCEVCNKTFSTKYVLAYHIKSDHLGMKRRYICPTCGKSFSQKNSYIQHANVHMGYKPFRCEVCGKSFSYDKSLKEHKFMHDEKKRFNCPICGKAFRQSSAITIHLKVHKETKDYVCSACGKGFSQKQALVRHERIHLGEKPFVCQLCQRTFTDSSVLRRHMILIHKKDPKKWKEDTKQNTVRRTDFFISVIGDKNKAVVAEEVLEGVDVSNGIQVDEEETENVAEDTGDVKGNIHISSITVAAQGVEETQEKATLQQNQQQMHQLGMPMEVSIITSSPQQFHSARLLADIIPKSEIQVQQAVTMPEEQILDSTHNEQVDSKAYIHVLDQRGEGFINQTNPILPYHLMGTVDYNIPSMEIVPEVSTAAFDSKGNFHQAHYVDPNTSTANHGIPYANYQPQDG